MDARLRAGRWHNAAMSSTDCLVSTVTPQTAAGIVRNARGALTFSVWPLDEEPRPLVVLEGARPERINGPDWYAVGGQAPTNAAAVEVKTESGMWQEGVVREGAWVALVRERPHSNALPPARFLDDNGALLTPDIPRDRYRPVTAEEKRAFTAPGGLPSHCPVCGADAWAIADEPGLAAIACGNCGFSDGLARGVTPFE